jgi:hypothetical protein
LGRCVVGAFTFRDLVHPRGQDVDRLPGEACSKLGLPKAGQRIGQRVLLGTELPQVDAEGEAQEVGSVERGPQGAPEDRLLDGSTQSQADRGRDQVVVHGRDSGWVGPRIVARDRGSGRAPVCYTRVARPIWARPSNSYPRERGVPPRPTGAVD